MGSLDDDEAGVFGVDEAALLDHPQRVERFSDEVADNAVAGHIAWLVDLVDDRAEVVAALEEEVDGEAAVGLVRNDGGPVGKGSADESMFILPVDAHDLRHSVHRVEPQRARLHRCQHQQQFCPSNVEGLEEVGEGEHVVEVLVLDESRVPLGPQAARVDDHEVGLGDGVVHEGGDEIGEFALAVDLGVEEDLVFCDQFQEGGHFGQPFLLVDGLDLGVRLDLAIVEAVIDQLARHPHFFERLVVAGAVVGEDLFADGDGSLDDRLDEGGAVELEVEDVEVVAAVDGPEVGDALVEVMGEFVAVALQDAVDSASGERVDESVELVLHPALFLLGIDGPPSVGAVHLAVVAHVGHYQYCVCPVLLQLLALGNHDLRVVQELVLRELLLLEGVGRVRSEDRSQPDYPNPDPALELVNLRQALLRQELGRPAFRADVGGKGGGFLGLEEGQQHVGAEVELVVADCRAADLDGVEEVVHDLPGTDEGRAFDAALELVARVEDERVAGVLAFDDLDESAHVGETPVGVVLLSVLPLHGGRQGGPVDVVRGDNGHSRELSEGTAQQEGGRQPPGKATFGHVALLLQLSTRYPFPNKYEIHTQNHEYQFQENSATCVRTSSGVKRKMLPRALKLPLKRRMILKTFCLASSRVMGEELKKQTGCEFAPDISSTPFTQASATAVIEFSHRKSYSKTRCLQMKAHNSSRRLSRSSGVPSSPASRPMASLRASSQAWYSASLSMARSKKVQELRWQSSRFMIRSSMASRSSRGSLRWPIFSKTVRVFSGKTSFILLAISMHCTPMRWRRAGGRASGSASKQRSMICTPSKQVLLAKRQELVTSTIQSSILARSCTSISWRPRKRGHGWALVSARRSCSAQRVQNCAVLERVFLRRKVGLSWMLVETDWQSLSECGHLCIEPISAYRFLLPFLKSFSFSQCTRWIIPCCILLLSFIIIRSRIIRHFSPRQKRAVLLMENEEPTAWAEGDEVGGRFNIFITKIIFEMRVGREQARSSLQAHGEFTGWQEEGAQGGENILKQFRKNLNEYERNFNDLARGAGKPKRRSQSLLKDSLSDKENYIKLPALNGKQDYCAFLESELTRNPAQLQQSSAANCMEKKAPKVFVYIEQPIRRHNRCESFIQFYRNKPEAKPINLFLKKHKVFSISRTLKLSKMKDRRVSTKLITYDPLSKDIQYKYSSDITLQHA